MEHITIFLLALILSLILTPVVGKLMRRLKVINKPSEERWSTKSIALMGGIAIFVSFMFAALLKLELSREMFVILAGGGIVFILGLFDDLFGIHPGFKLAVQFFVALGTVYFGVVSKIFPYSWLNISMTVIWIVGLTNAFNMLDNMDGLSSGIAVIASLSLLGLSIGNGESNSALLCLVLAGSCLGFLRYNFSPARIFMGDCGSLFLGYALSTIAILGGWQHSSSVIKGFLPPILILGVVIFDTTLVTILRLKHGKMPWQGGRDHSSHRLACILGGKERIAVLILYGIGILVGLSGLIATRLDLLMSVTISVVLGMGMILFGKWLTKIECYKIGRDKNMMSG